MSKKFFYVTIGHIIKQCRSAARCLKCGLGHKSDTCEDVVPKNCLNCKGNHLTTQLTLCPEFQRQKRIKNTMAQVNLSYSEASDLTPRISYSDAVKSGTTHYTSNISNPAKSQEPARLNPTTDRKAILTYNDMPPGKSWPSCSAPSDKRPVKRTCPHLRMLRF